MTGEILTTQRKIIINIRSHFETALQNEQRLTHFLLLLFLLDWNTMINLNIVVSFRNKRGSWNLRSE